MRTNRGLAWAAVLGSLVASWAVGPNSAQNRNAVGKLMPPDAIPPKQQVFRFLNDEPTSLDIGVVIYEVGGITFLFERLTMLDQNNRVIPGAASSWESSANGTRWIFHLRKGGQWSDGRPVTAHDFEYSFKRLLDPANGNPYAFFYYDIKGARPFNTGRTKDRSQVGVRAVDDLTLVIDTEGPCPYLPMIAAFFTSAPVPRWQVERYGHRWTNAGNCVSNSSYRLAEWQPGRHLTFKLDSRYNGPNKGSLSKITSIFIKPSTHSGILPYENNEVDLIQVDVRDLPRVQNDPKLRAELHTYMDYNTFYLFFKTSERPFNDRRVCQAISHAVDRDTLCRVVLRGSAIPAYAMIPKGFPGSSEDQLKPIQRFDPMLARRLLAEAGYPGGRGFPATELWLRGELPRHVIATEAIQGMLKEHLNIDVRVRNMEAKVYTDNMMRYTIPMSLIPFQYDFPDPHNLLGMVWHSQPRGSGRHDWANAQFDRLIEAAARETNWTKRQQLYTNAEHILVEDAGGVFVFHEYVLLLRKPWLAGWKRDTLGQEPFFIDNTTMMDLYITKRYH